MRRRVRVLLWSLLALVVAVVGCAVLLYRAAHQVPEFYERAVAAALPPAQRRAASDQLERQVLELHNDARRTGAWQLTLSEQQLNAWLETDLTGKFPHALPGAVREPRVHLAPGAVQVACRYEGQHWQGVLWLTAELSLTDQPNEIAIRLRELRAGWLPLPLNQMIERVSTQAQQLGVPLRWTQQDADPVALVRVPTQDPQDERREILLEALSLRAGEVLLSGRTVRRASP